METKKRFFLKAAGISLAKAAGISLAFVLTFAMAFAACDTGTSSSRTPTEDDDNGGGGGGGGGGDTTADTVYTSGNYVLTITEATSGAVTYRLAYGNTVSSGTVTVVGSYWAFTSYTGETFTMYVGGTGANRTFVPTPPTTIRADDGTSTITIPSFGTVSGGDGDNTGSPGPTYTVTDEKTLRADLAKDNNGEYKQGVFRIINVMTLEEDLVVHPGQHIVVGGTGENVGQYSAGGPLFAAGGTSNTLNIGARLKLEAGLSATSDGATLTIARGGAVNVKNGGVLYAEGGTKGAKVGVGVSVSGTSIGTSSTVSSLHIAGGGALHIERDATLAVTNNVSRSKVYLEAATSALTLEDDADLAITVDTTPITVEEDDDDDGDPNPAGTAEARRIIGTTSASVIEIPADKSAAAIGAVTVTGYTGTIASVITDTVNTAAGAEGATKNSTAATTNDADTAKTALANGFKSVTYSGDTALPTGITFVSGQTLIISGDVEDQEYAIGAGGGKLEITGSVSLKNTVADQAILKSFVAAPGGGKVVLTHTTASVSVTGALDVNQTLEIASGVTLALDPTGKIGGTGTIVNKGTISTAQAKITSTEVGDFLARVGGNGGTFEVKAAPITVAAGTTLAIPAGTTLALSTSASVKLTVEETGTLSVEKGASITTADGATIINNGTINTATENATVLTTLVAATVTEGASGKVVLNGTDATHKAEVTLGAALSLTQDLEIGQYATLKLLTFAVNGSADVTNNGTIDFGTTGTITSTGTVTNNGTMNLGTTTGTIPAAKTTNNGTINTEATGSSDGAILRGLVGLKGTGTVSWNGTAAVTATLTGNLELATQDLVIGDKATLILAANALTVKAGTTGSITNNGIIKTDTDIGLLTTPGTGTIVLTGTAAASGNIALTTQKLEIDETNGILNLGANTITPVANITKNDGTINTTTNAEATLRALVGIAGEGTVSWNGTDPDADGAVVAVPLGAPLELATQDLVIGEFATLNLGTHALTIDGDGTGSIDNSGTIKTAAATVDALEAVLELGGVIEIGSFVVDEDEVLTVPDGTTLKLGNGTTPATLTLTAQDSGEAPGQLVLLAGGIVNAANDDSTISGVAASGGISVAASSGTNSAMSVTKGSGTDWTIALVTDQVLTGSPVKLGKLQILVAPAITHNQDGTAAGTLTAGADTTITFAGEDA